MIINVKIIEQCKTRKFFLVAEAESKRSFRINPNNKGTGFNFNNKTNIYIGKVSTLKNAEKEKEKLINDLKSFKYIIKDQGIDYQLHDLQQGTKVRLKSNNCLIGDCEGTKIIEDYEEAGYNIYEIISFNRKNIKFKDLNNKRLINTSISVFTSDFELI